jgi:hypothetical protein
MPVITRAIQLGTSRPTCGRTGGRLQSFDDHVLIRRWRPSQRIEFSEEGRRIHFVVPAGFVRTCLSWRQTKKPYAARRAPAASASDSHIGKFLPRQEFPSKGATGITPQWRPL